MAYRERSSRRWFTKDHQQLLEVSWWRKWFWFRVTWGDDESNSRIGISMFFGAGFWLYLPWPTRLTYKPRSLFEIELHIPDAADDPYLSIEFLSPRHEWSRSEPWWMRWKIDPVVWLFGQREAETEYGQKRRLLVRTSDDLFVMASACPYTVTHRRKRWPWVWQRWTNYKIDLAQGIGPKGTRGRGGPADSLDDFLRRFEEEHDVVIKEDVMQTMKESLDGPGNLVADG